MRANLVENENENLVEINKRDFEDKLVEHIKWLDDDLTGTRLVLTNAELRGMDMRGKIGLYLRDEDLRCSDFSGLNLENVIFSGSNLRGANLSYSNLQGAVLKEANLTATNCTGTNFSDANMDGTILTDARLTGANFTRVYGVRSGDDTNYTICRCKHSINNW